MSSKQEVLRVDPLGKDLSALQKPADIIKNGGLVAFPTETVYGLGANALDERAVKRLFKVKKRSLNDPLIVHISEMSQLRRIVLEVPNVAEILADNFWPGPLTMIFNSNRAVADLVSAGLDTVAVRMPSGKIAQEIIRRASVPIAAPSANMFGRVSPTSAEHVLEELGGKIDMVVDGGRTDIGIESTVCDVTGSSMEILRPGSVDIDFLSKISGKDVVGVKGPTKLRRSPGNFPRHYSPRCELLVVERGPDQANDVIDKYRAFSEKGMSVGILATREHADMFPTENLCVLGPSENGELCARNLYAMLRDLDKRGCDIIIAEAVKSKKMGLAVMNRLYKAAGRGS